MLRWPPVSSSTVRPRGEQPLHERNDLRLQQRLAAGHLDQRQPSRATSASTSSTDILRPPVKA